jgi:hypothetical protein
MRSVKRINWFLVVGILLGISLLAAAVSLYLVQQQRIDAQHTRIVADAKANDELQQQYQGLVGQYTQAYGQLKDSGVQPTTAPPSTLSSSPGTPGERGSSGADGQDGRGIAFALCTATGWAITYTDGATDNAGACVGSTGPAGPSGKVGTAGVPGAPGIPGTPGTNGTDGTDGTNGLDGRDGKDGKDGTDVASVTCTATDAGTAFRFTLTDGTTQDVAGTCTPPASDPTATPAP